MLHYESDKNDKSHAGFEAEKGFAGPAAASEISPNPRSKPTGSESGLSGSESNGIHNLPGLYGPLCSVHSVYENVRAAIDNSNESPIPEGRAWPWISWSVQFSQRRPSFFSSTALLLYYTIPREASNSIDGLLFTNAPPQILE